MKRYETAGQETLPRHLESEEESAPPRPVSPDDRPAEPSPAEAVTPYDEIWFDRRPLS